MLQAKRTFAARWPALAGCLLVGALASPAQEQVPVFRSQTTLIEFTLIALDKQGNPVTDLKQEEIVLKDRGRRRELAFFRYEGAEPPRPVPPLPAGAFTNRVEFTPGPPRNITAIVLDALNTQPSDQVWVKAQVLRYLRELLPNTRVAVYVLGENLAVLHDFTDDSESLRARMEQAQIRLTSQKLEDLEELARDAEVLIDSVLPENREMATEMMTRHLETQMVANELANQRRTAKTLALLETLGDHLAGIPGRKSMVWIGGGISMLSVTGSMSRGPRGGTRSYEEWVRNTSRRLAQQGITMYMIDARGMRGPAATSGLSVERGREAPGARGRVSAFERHEQAAAISSDPLPAMYKMAGVTGGRVFWNTNDTARGIDAITADSQGTYSLGFYVDSEADTKWHSLDVRVNRKGVKAQHRDGYLSATVPEAPLDWTEDQWRAAVYNPLGSTAVRLDARCQSDAASGPQTVSVTLQIVSDDLHFRQAGDQSAAEVDVVMVDKLPNAQFRMQRDRMTIPFPVEESGEPGVVRCRHNWELTPGASAVRLIVRDRFTGLYGTLDIAVKDIPRIDAAAEGSRSDTDGPQ